MFKKLHSFQDDSQFTMNQDKKNQQITYKKAFIKNSALKKKHQSYGQKFRKKHHLLPQIPQLQIVQSDGFIFQGRLASVIQSSSSLIPSDRQKHGEGVMFLKNGTVIIGFWDHGLLHGRALIFTSFGGKTIAQFYNGKLNGWAITIFAEKLIVCAIYYDNKIHGQKIIFQANQKMWVGSKYFQQTNSFKIIHVQKGKMNQLPDFVKSSDTSQLVDLYEQFIINENTCMILKQIQFLPITQNLTYIGYCNEQNHPNGMGVIYGKKQFYLGHFRQGSLECYGRMIFQNGQIYQGQLLNGVFYGQGVYYNPSKNLSTIMSTNRDQQKIIDQQQGYICINTPLNYFKYNKHGQTGMIGDALSSISQIIQKYYSRFFIQNKQNISDNISANSQFGVSQNVDDIEQSLNKYQISGKKQQKNKQNSKMSLDQDKRWLNFNTVQSPSLDKSIQLGNHQEQSSVRLQRAYSLDKRQAAHNRQYLAQQSIPVNIQKDKAYSKIKQQQGLEEELKKIAMERNLSLRQRKPQNVHFQQNKKVKQNINPKDLYPNFKISSTEVVNQNPNNLPKRNTLNINLKSHGKQDQEAMTFRNKNEYGKQDRQLQLIKNQRKYSHMVESNANFSPQDSVISNYSQKVDGLVQKTNTKRRKIFM